jgi:hypothetical protein
MNCFNFYHLFYFFNDSHSCLFEKVTIAAINPFTFKVLEETAFELNDTVVDVALEQRKDDGMVILAISQKTAGVWIYSFDGDAFQFLQVTEIIKCKSIRLLTNFAL